MFLTALTWVAASFPSTAFAYDPDAPCCHDNGGPPRWYAGMTGSAVFLNDVDIKHSSAAYTNPDGQKFHIGAGISGEVGYKLFSGIRTELEISQRNNTVSKDNAATNAIPAGKTVEQKSTAIMFNTYVDLHNSSSYTPYFGAGVGEVYVKNPRYYTDNGTGQISDKLVAWTMGYQFMFGVNYELNTFQFPMEIGLGYRYFTGQDVKTKSTLTNFPSNLSFSNTSQNIELGGRVYF